VRGGRPDRGQRDLAQPGGACGEHGAAADPGQQPPEEQQRDTVGAGDQHRAGEQRQRGGGNDDCAASTRVRQRPDEQQPRDQTERVEAEHRLERALSQSSSVWR
jgi:hypothetical protein